MWVYDRHAEQEKIIVKNDVNGLITRITQQSNLVQEAISGICYATAGAPSGLGDEMAQDCRQALEQISQALQELHMCKKSLDAIEIREWVDDE